MALHMLLRQRSRLQPPEPHCEPPASPAALTAPGADIACAARPLQQRGPHCEAPALLAAPTATAARTACPVLRVQTPEPHSAEPASTAARTAPAADIACAESCARQQRVSADATRFWRARAAALEETAEHIYTQHRISGPNATSELPCANQLEHSNILKTNVQTSWSIRTFERQMRKPAEALEYFNKNTQTSESIQIF